MCFYAPPRLHFCIHPQKRPQRAHPLRFFEIVAEIEIEIIYIEYA